MNKIKEKLKEYVYNAINFFLLLKYKKNSTKLGVNKDEDRKQKIIVSLTTIPARIENLWLVIESIFNQKVKADNIILWLAKEEFEGVQLPDRLLQQKQRGLEIRYCEDLKPHKKYFYTMQEFPNNIVITIDDDVYYNKRLIQKLMKSYKKFPMSVSCMRAHKITFSDEKQINPYKQWRHKIRQFAKPSKDLIAIGVGGILYPPKILDKRAFNEEKIKELSLYADDLWLKTMEILNNVDVVKANRGNGWVILIKNTQKTALFHENVEKLNRNDTYLKKLVSEYNIKINV